ncbi:MAG: hypothetical protein O7A06_03050 [Acidobacteria bacterium]|nr:hypothetical protein [Acidobacteriota bacterium]
MREKILLAGVLLLIYAPVATWGHFDFSDLQGFYNMLADGFDKGNLYVAARPDQIDIWDLIPYEGHYYLQWGPFPALLHLAVKWLGTELSDRAACVIAGLLTALLFFSIILRLRRNYFRRLPKSVCTWFLFAFALASPLAFVSLRGTIYHESIVVAGLGIMGAFFAYLRYLEGGALRWAFLCGLGTAAAMATRISLGVYALVLGVAVLAVQYLRKHSLPKASAHLLTYSGPILLSAGLLLAYNQARFGSPWDFGIRYLLSSVTEGGINAFEIERVPENLRQYLLAPIKYEPDYPWLIHDGWPPLETTNRAEDMSSLLIMSPFLLLGLLAWPLLRPAHQGGGHREGGQPLELRLYFATAALSSMLMFGVMMSFAASSRRYSHDFVAPWMIVVFLGVALQSGKQVRWGRWLAAGWGVVLVSGLLHAHLCFTRPEPGDLNVVRTFVALSPYARKILPGGPNWDREEAIARNDLGTVYMKQRQFHAALEQFEKAAKLMPNEPRIERNVRLARRLASDGR